jgi:hypothetical protein
MKKSIESLVAKMAIGKDGSIKGGFAAIRGGAMLFDATNRGFSCDNTGTCSGTNENVCDNSGNCTNATNQTKNCTNSGTCLV